MKFKRFFLAALAAIPGFLSAQSDYFSNDPTGSVTTNCILQTWRIDGDSLGTVRQVSFPIILTVPLNPAVQLTIVHTPAFSQANDLYDQSIRSRNKHEQLKVSGMSDTWVQGTYLFPSNMAMLNIGFGVPTGKTRLNNYQFALARQLSLNIFRYQLPIYGQGFCGHAGGAVAFPVGKMAILGLGGQYLYRGKYHPVSYTYEYPGNVKPQSPYDPEYKPGDELTVQAGLDILLGEKLKLMADFEYTLYQRDLLAGSEVFKSGTRSLASMGLYHQFEQRFLMVNVRYRIKGKHEYLDSLAFKMQASDRNLLGNQVEADIVYKAYAFRDGGVLLLGDVRAFSRNEFDTDGWLAIGGGLGIQFPMGESVFGDFRIKYLGGNANNPFTRKLLGLETGFGLKFVL